MSFRLKAVISLALLALLALYSPVISWMWRGWWLASGPRYYSNGLLIVLISLFLVLRERQSFNIKYFLR